MRKIDILIFVTVLVNISCKKGSERITYYENGAIKTVTEMENGMMHGKHEYYYPSRKLESKGYILKEKRTESWSIFLKMAKLGLPLLGEMERKMVLPKSFPQIRNYFFPQFINKERS